MSDNEPTREELASSIREMFVAACSYILAGDPDRRVRYDHNGISRFRKAQGLLVRLGVISEEDCDRK